MQSDILAGLLEATLASSIAIVIVLLLRVPLRRVFGAQSVRSLWLIVLLAPLATLLPAPKDTAIPFAAATDPVVATPQSVSALPVAVAGETLPWSVLLLAAWVAGMFASIVVVWRRQRAFLRTLGVLTPIGGGVWQAASSRGTPALVCDRRAVGRVLHLLHHRSITPGRRHHIGTPVLQDVRPLLQRVTPAIGR